MAPFVMTGLSEYGRLSAVVMKHARDAFVSDERIARQWQALNYSSTLVVGNESLHSTSIG